MAMMEKFYGLVRNVYIPFTKINRAFFLSFLFLLLPRVETLTMDFSAFYDISKLESFHDKLRRLSLFRNYLSKAEARIRSIESLFTTTNLSARLIRFD